MSAAEAQILQDRVDAIAALVVELQKDERARFASDAYYNAIGDTINALEDASMVLIRGIWAVEDKLTGLLPETPAQDYTVFK